MECIVPKMPPLQSMYWYILRVFAVDQANISEPKLVGIFLLSDFIHTKYSFADPNMNMQKPLILKLLAASLDCASVAILKWWMKDSIFYYFIYF